MTDQELERELRKLRNAEIASLKWQSRIEELQASIADKLSSLKREFDKCTKAEIRIRDRLKDDAIDYYKANDKKERETLLGKVQIQIRHDLDIYDRDALFAFIAKKDMSDKLVKWDFDKTKLNKWCSAMKEVGNDLEGAKFDEKYVLSVIWPKEGI